MIFKLKKVNLELIERGLKTEIRPIHKPKKTKMMKEPKF